MQAAALRINSVPKDGGNTFSGTFFAYGQGSSLQATTGPTPSSRSSRCGTAYDYQINPSFGGPLMQDKLWFYSPTNTRPEVLRPSSKSPTAARRTETPWATTAGLVD